MLMFEELRNELKKELYAQDENGLYVRLEPVARIKANAFFPVAGNFFFPPLPVMQEDDDHADVHNVCSLDSFQHFNDCYNDLRGIFIIPLVSNFLSQQHVLKCALELNLMFINIISLSPERVSHSLSNVCEEFFCALYYVINMVIAMVTLTPAFVLRCLLTLTDMVNQLITHEEMKLGSPCPA